MMVNKRGNGWAMEAGFEVFAKQPRQPLTDAGKVRETMAAAREALGKFVLKDDLASEDIGIPRAKGQGTIYLRTYQRRMPGVKQPVLLYIHGGGFFCGDLRSEEEQCARYAMEASCVVVSVDYRLAPEHPFPAALEDCYAALEWLRDPQIPLAIDHKRIAVGGSSAGANLAAAVALLSRDRGDRTLCFQMLLVPPVHPGLESESAKAFDAVPDFSTAEAKIMWEWYLAGSAENPSPYAAPAFASDLSGLPEAYVLCAGLDPLRDEGLAYAKRMLMAGVPVEIHLVPRIPHGFAGVPSAEVTQRLLREQIDVLRAAFRP